MSNLKSNTNRTQTPQKKFIEGIVSALVKLDSDLSPRRSSGSIAEALPELAMSKNKIVGMYTDFVKKFLEIGELERNVFIYSVALAKKVVKKAKAEFAFKKGEFVLLYSACLYLSIKMLVDEERWFLADFSYVSGLEEAHIEKMEIFVVDEIMNFDYKISDEIFEKEKKILCPPTVVRRSRQVKTNFN